MDQFRNQIWGLAYRIQSSFGYNHNQNDAYEITNVDKGQVEKAKKEIETFMDDTAIFRSHPNYNAPVGILNGIRFLLDSGRFPLLTGEDP